MNKLKLSIMLFICTISSNTYILTGQVQLHKTIYFDYNSYTISPTAIVDLQEFVSKIDSFTECNIQILGHTDQDGTDDYNINLSQRRAASVKKFINQQVHSDINFDVRPLGERAPINDGNTESAKQKNRRVSIMATGFYYNNMQDLITQLSPTSDKRITINANQETIIELPKGTIVSIPPNAFCQANGRPIDNPSVDLLFKEAFDYIDMVEEKLYTQTEDQILETGGMIYIEARQKNQVLRVAKGKEIKLELPKQEYKEGMKVFSAVEDNFGTVWKDTGEKVISKKDTPYIQIDMSSLWDFEFETEDPVKTSFSEMPRYPHPKRKAYPPYRKKYSEDEYNEAYRKYEETMKTYHKYEKERPQKVIEWNNEVTERIKIMNDQKRLFVKKEAQKILQHEISKMQDKKSTVSNDKLVSYFSDILKRSVKIVRYDDMYHCRQIFKGAVKDVFDNREVNFLNYHNYSNAAFFPELDTIIKTLQAEVVASKYESGYMDNKVVSSYVMRIRSLGWINCDRFINTPQNDKMDLTLGKSIDADQYYMIFKGIKSMIRPSFEQSEITFRDLPIGEHVKLICLKFNQSEVFIASQDMQVKHDNPIDLHFKKSRIKDIKDAFKSI